MSFRGFQLHVRHHNEAAILRVRYQKPSGLCHMPAVYAPRHILVACPAVAIDTPSSQCGRLTALALSDWRPQSSLWGCYVFGKLSRPSQAAASIEACDSSPSFSQASIKAHVPRWWTGPVVLGHAASGLQRGQSEDIRDAVAGMDPRPLPRRRWAYAIPNSCDWRVSWKKQPWKAISKNPGLLGLAVAAQTPGGKLGLCHKRRHAGGRRESVLMQDSEWTESTFSTPCDSAQPPARECRRRGQPELAHLKVACAS